MKRVKQPQHGGFALGLVSGLLLGLALALGVALYITKAPVPFINKVPQRTAEQDQAEQQRNRNWDPNAPLAGKPPRVAQAASAAASAASSAGAALATAAPASAGSGAAGLDPAAILSGAQTPGPQIPAGIVFFVQAGAYSRVEEAEQQRARLAMLGHGARISERDQHGRVVYRVRMGPYPTRSEAEGLQSRLLSSSIESQLVRAEQRP